METRSRPIIPVTPTNLEEQYMPYSDTLATYPWPDPICSFLEAGELRVSQEMFNNIPFEQ